MPVTVPTGGEKQAREVVSMPPVPVHVSKKEMVPKESIYIMVPGNPNVSSVSYIALSITSFGISTSFASLYE